MPANLTFLINSPRIIESFTATRRQHIDTPEPALCLEGAGAADDETYLGTVPFRRDSSVGAAAIAVMRKKEHDVRDAFRSAGAITPANAMSLEAVGIEETMAVRRLKKRAVIREAAPGLFYFDEDVWEAVTAMRRRMALLMLGTVILIGIVLLYGSAAMK